MSLKRRRTGLQTGIEEYDANQQNVANIATQTTHAEMDKEYIDMLRENHRAGVPSFTQNPDPINGLSSAFNGHISKFAWKRIDQDDQTLKVNCAINLADSEAMAAYPDDREQARMALKATSQTVGTFSQNSESVNGTKEDPEAALNVHGIETLHALSGVAGATAVVDFPPLGVEDMAVGSVLDGTECSAQYLVLRMADPDLESVKLHRAMAKIAQDPEAWRRAVGGHHDVFHSWNNAAIMQHNAALINGMIFLGILLKKGKISVPATDIDGNPNTDLLETDGSQLDELSMFTRLSQFFGLTSEGNAVELLSQSAAAQYHLIRNEMARKSSYMPALDGETKGKMNLNNEIGVSFDPAAGRLVSKARTPDDAFELRDGTAEAEAVGLQMNHRALATAAVMHAVNEEQRYVAGTFLTNVNQDGSGKAKISLHMGK